MATPNDAENSRSHDDSRLRQQMESVGRWMAERGIENQRLDWSALARQRRAERVRWQSVRNLGNLRWRLRSVMTNRATYKWHLTYPADQQTVLATYVGENLETFEDIVRRASVRLQYETGDGSFDAYTTGKPERVRAQCRAIYEEMRDLGLTYSVEPAGSVPVVQVVRLADELLRDKRGCCLDLVLLLAGALLRVGIFPLLTVVGNDAGPTHIVLGYWLKERTPRKGEVSRPVLTQKEWRKHFDDMAFVESTDLAAGQAKPFADAEKDSLTHLPSPGSSGNKVWYVVDVRACRLMGIEPVQPASNLARKHVAFGGLVGVISVVAVAVYLGAYPGSQRMTPISSPTGQAPLVRTAILNGTDLSTCTLAKPCKTSLNANGLLGLQLDRYGHYAVYVVDPSGNYFPQKNGEGTQEAVPVFFGGTGPFKVVVWTDAKPIVQNATTGRPNGEPAVFAHFIVD